MVFWQYDASQERGPLWLALQLQQQEMLVCAGLAPYLQNQCTAALMDMVV